VKGQRYFEKASSKAAAALEALVRSKGYPDATVQVATTSDEEGNVLLSLHIREGNPLIVREVRLSGDEESRISRYLKMAPGDVFDRTSLEKTVENLLAFYKRDGRVGTKIDTSFNDGVLAISVAVGRSLTVSFEGNSTVSSRELRKEIPFFELDEFSYELLDETVARLAIAYHREGFPDVQIAPVVTDDREALSIVFYLHEGERVRIGHIRFEGASLSEDRLRDVLELKDGGYYNPDVVSSDSDALTELYRSLGYLSAEVQEPEVEVSGDTASLLFRIREGIQVLIASITINTNVVVTSAELLRLIPLKIGNPYNEVDIFDARVKIQELYRSRGYIDATVSAEREIQEGTAGIILTVNEGELSRFGKSIIVGTEKTKRAVIARAIEHREDAPYNYSLLSQERQRLYRTGLFSDVEIVPGESEDGRRDVLYRVREGNAGAFEFGFGYGEYERLRGFMDVSYKNLMGMNRGIGFRTEVSTLEQRYIISYVDPWVFSRDSLFRANLLHENRKERGIDNHDIRFRLQRNAASAGIERKLDERLKAELFYELSQVRTSDVKPDIILSREDVGTLIISGIRAGLIYDTRDNPFEPRSGILAGLAYKVATGLFFSQTDFQKLSGYFNTYVGLARPLVLALSARSGIAQGFGSTRDLPLVERYFLGGRTTVRGYDQDTLGPKGSDNTPTGGNAFLMANAELRLDVWKGFGLVTFLDGGNVWQRMNDFSLTDIKYAVGIGLRYSTPVGPLRVDYGYKLNPERGESRDAIHFSIGHAF
jgi:outer membrane protein insertion porin family